MKALLRYLSALLVLHLIAVPAEADATKLCLRSVSSRSPLDAPTAKAAGRIVSRRSQVIAPSFIESPEGGKFPLIYDAFTEQLPDGEKRNRTFFWRFGSAGELFGPYDLDSHAIRVKLSHNGTGAAAADPNGRVLFLVGSYEGSGSERTWQQQIYSQDWGEQPVPFVPDLQVRLEQPGAIFWSDLQQAFLIQGTSRDPETGGAKFTTSIVAGTSIRVLDDYDMDIASDLPSLGVTALLGFSRLAFVDHQGVPTLMGLIRSGPEGDSWNGIHETADAEWLYVDGDEYDHAVRVEKRDGSWRIASLIRFVNDEGTFDRYKDQARMEMEGLSQIILTARCRAFSAAIRRMIVCGDRMQELRAGRLVPISSGDERLVRYLGDAPYLGVALFRSAVGRLYAYDGDRLQLASGTLPDIALVQDLPSSKRTFLSTSTSLFELRQDGQDFRLEELNAPSPHEDLLFTRFFDVSGNVVALLREGVYAVDNLELRPIRFPRGPDQVDTTSHLQPRYVPSLSGVLFASTVGVNDTPQFRLLAPCSGSD